MRIAIIGAGITGLTAAYELTKKGHPVVIFEKDRFAGGLASGIRQVVTDYPTNWDWDIERFYHHWFTNDYAILHLIEELGAEREVLTLRPITSSLYQGKTYPLDTPLALLKFSPISIPSRLRTGLAIAYLKSLVRPDQTEKLESITAADWLKKYMGEESYRILWEPLLKGKFDRYYNQINTTWFWARIFKRTPNLAYFNGGFGALVNLLVEKIKGQGGELHLSHTVESITPTANSQVMLPPYSLPFDKVIVTTPPPLFTKLAPNLPSDYKRQLTTLKGIGAFVLIYVFNQPLMNKTYWLNIHETDWPFLIVAEHTNFVDPAHYGGKHIVWVGDYVPTDHPHMQMDQITLAQKFAPYLKKLNPSFSDEEIVHSAKWLFRESFAQPIVGLNHASKIPPIKTPLENVYLASMSQVYPWDRGTNYAVELGQKVVQKVLS